MIVAALMSGAAGISNAQVKVGDNPTTINANAALEIESNSKGLLLPRVALTAATNPAPLAAHVAGMQVYNTRLDPGADLYPGLFFNDGAKWVRSNVSESSGAITEGNGAPTGTCTNPGEMYTDTASASATNGQVWICSGGSWVNYISTKSSTPFYLGYGPGDAGGTKTSRISRSGNILLSSPGAVSGYANTGTASKDVLVLGSGVIQSQMSGPVPNLYLSKKTANVGDTYVRFYLNGSLVGHITRSTAGIAYNTASDRRLKENIDATRFSLKDLMKIEIKDYNFISDSTKARTTGVIAQELYKIYPDAVTVGGEDATENAWQVDYGKLTPLLVKALQDQQKLIEKQEKKIADLQYTVDERLAKLEHKSLKKENRVSRRLQKKKVADPRLYALQAK